MANVWMIRYRGNCLSSHELYKIMPCSLRFVSICARHSFSWCFPRLILLWIFEDHVHSFQLEFCHTFLLAMLFLILAWSIVAMNLGSVLATVQFRGANIAGYDMLAFVGIHLANDVQIRLRMFYRCMLLLTHQIAADSKGHTLSRALASPPRLMVP